MADAHWWPVRFAGGRRQDPAPQDPARRNPVGWDAPPMPPASGVIERCSDAELARRLRDADPAALAELYQRFGRLCYSLAHRICADAKLAEDVVHEVFLTLWRDPGRFDPARESFATWLITVLHHTAVDAARRQRPSHRPTAAAAPDQEWPVAPVAGTGQATSARVAASQVRAALDQLPGEQRQVLVGAYFGGHTLHEIAAFTGVPLGTVKARLLAGVQRLRVMLAERLGPDALVAEARAVWKLSR